MHTFVHRIPAESIYYILYHLSHVTAGGIQDFYTRLGTGWGAGAKALASPLPPHSGKDKEGWVIHLFILKWHAFNCKYMYLVCHNSMMDRELSPHSHFLGDICVALVSTYIYGVCPDPYFVSYIVQTLWGWVYVCLPWVVRQHTVTVCRVCLHAQHF